MCSDKPTVHWGTTMQKQYYSAQSLDNAIQEFEREYGVSSEQMYEAYMAGDAVEGVERFTMHVWASFYEDVLRLTNGEGVQRKPIMDRVGRALLCA
jgi:hypothetical protein